MTEKSKRIKNYIVLTVDETDYRFENSHVAYGTYIDGLGRGKLVQASKNFLIQTIHNEDLASLRDLFSANPGAALQIAAELSDRIALQVEVAVKKQ